jgi:hypothetical protein
MKAFLCRVTLLLAVAGFALAAVAEEAPSEPPNAAARSETATSTAPRRVWLVPEGSLVVNLPSDQSIGKGLLQFLVTHRFRAPVRGSNAHSLYSLNSGADFGLGLSYAPIKNGEVSLYRSGIQDDYELAVKYSVRPGGPRSLFGTAIRLGGDDRREAFVISDNGVFRPDSKARVAFFAQAILTIHLLDDRMEVSLVPSYVSRTVSQQRVFNLPVHAAFAVGRSFNVLAEYQPPRKNLDGSVSHWTVGLEKVLFRHRFTLVVSNATVTAVDQMLSGDFALSAKRQRFFDSGFRNNDWHIGFNLVRQFKIGN